MPRWPSGWGAASTAVLLAVLAAAGTTATESYLEQDRQACEERVMRATLQQLSDLRGRLENELNGALYLASGIEAFIRANQGHVRDDEMGRALAVLVSRSKLIRNIGIAPDNRIRFVHPLAGNEQALGLDYRDSAQQWPGIARVIASRQPFLAGPVDLVQGGRGLIFRVPVFLDDDRYWGIVSTVIDHDRLWQQVGASRHAFDGVTVHGQDAAGAGGARIHGPERQPGTEVMGLDVLVPGGSWRITCPMVEEEGLADRVVTIRAIGHGSTAAMVAFFLFAFTSKRRLRRARDAAEAAARTKSNFLAMMSHEIRTPMNGIVGMTQMLVDADLPPLVADYARTARDSAQSLMVILDDILDYSKIESGRFAVESVSFDLPQLLRDVAGLFALRAHEKGLELRVQLDASLPRCVASDPTRLRQILTNLLANAVKFTERGAIELAARLGRTAAGIDAIEIAVRDTGIGIAPDVLPSLFQPFQQGDSSTTRRFGGTGLGLSISRQLARQLGGDIAVASEPGRGTEFTLRLALPAAPCPIAPIAGPVPQRAASATRTVLLVEDNAVNQKVAVAMLRALGVEAAVADSGTQALQQLAECTFDLVLMDMQMPGMDGPATARAIRDPASAVRQHDVPIVALTANVLSEHRDECRAAGMDGFLGKPLRKELLAEVVERWLR